MENRLGASYVATNLFALRVNSLENLMEKGLWTALENNIAG